MLFSKIIQKMRHIPLAALTCSIAAAASADVNVYSYRQADLIAPLIDAFTEETGIKVNVVHLKKGLAERLKAEGRRSPADLIFTVDISRLHAAVEAGLTASVQSDKITQTVPAHFRDPEEHWFGLTLRARIIYASKARVNPDDIQHYEDLADPKWKGRICTRSGVHAYNIALTSAYLYHHGVDETKTWLKAVKDNLARRPQGNDRAQVKAIWAGECDIAIGNTYYMGKMLADPEQNAWANSVNVVFPTFQEGGTHMNVSGVALTKHAPNREEAIALIEFLTSERAQEIYAQINHEYPVSSNADPSELVKSWGEVTPDTANLVELARIRPQALQITQSVDFDG